MFISGYANTGKKVSYCFYKITSSKNCNAGKDEKFILNVSSYNINLPMGFLNPPIKTLYAFHAVQTFKSVRYGKYGMYAKSVSVCPI